MAKKDDEIAATSGQRQRSRLRNTPHDPLQPKRLNVRDEWKTIGIVLDRYNAIETMMAGAIRLYIGPKHERVQWVENRLLNNLIIPFSAKVKLVRAISKEVGGPKLKDEECNTLMSTRNAMAHGHLFKAMRFTSAKGMNAAISGRPTPDAYLVIESVTNSGQLSTVNRDKAVADFLRVADTVSAQLKDLLLKLGAAEESL